MSEPETLCACCNNALYVDCCKPYHDGKTVAPTAVALMRSRYSAFVYGEVNYLVKTTLPAKRTADLESYYKATSESIFWISLEVVGTLQGGPSDKVGKVEFKASYSQAGRIKTYHECSRFRRKGEHWYYVDGI